MTLLPSASTKRVALHFAVIKLVLDLRLEGLKLHISRANSDLRFFLDTTNYWNEAISIIEKKRRWYFELDVPYPTADTTGQDKMPASDIEWSEYEEQYLNGFLQGSSERRYPSRMFCLGLLVVHGTFQALAHRYKLRHHRLKWLAQQPCTVCPHTHSIKLFFYKNHKLTSRAANRFPTSRRR